MAAVMDFHSHILPGIDDGSETVEQSMEMLRMEWEQGIRHVVATPHFYPRHDTLEQFLSRRDRAEELLRREMEGQADMPRLSVGAEVYWFRGLSQSDLVPRLTLQGKKCILIEMPHAPWPDAVYEELKEIWTRWGIIPVVAHIERYITPLRAGETMKRLAELPVLVQSNAEFFLERSTSALAMKMLKADQIQLLGSDCHDLSRRKPNLGPALELIQRKLGEGPIKEIQRYERLVMGRNNRTE